MKFQAHLAALSTLIAANLFAQSVALDEKLIQKLAHEQNPTRQSIETTYLQSAYARSSYDEKFNTNLVATGSYAHSNEQAIASFIPVFAPSTEFSVGLERPMIWGATATVDMFTAQQSTADGLLNQATRTGVRAGVSFDLWKNIGGRLDRAELRGLEISQTKAKLQSEIDSRTLELNLRKIYWSLVANAESIRISEALLAVSEEQLKEAKKRLKASVTDKGTVARYSAQVASRKARLASLEYQKRNLIESLQSQLPALANKEITLAKYSVEDKVAEVLQCTAQIRSHKEVPWKFTSYDELVDLINQGYEQERIVTSAHSSVDLTLSGQVQMSGVDQGYGDSFTNFTNSGKLGYQVGLQLAIPLGGGPGRTEETKRKIDKVKAEAQRDQLKLQVKAKHQQIGQIIEYLYASLRQLEINTANLRTSVKQMERKYRQARVSAFDLIAEQEVLQSSLLAEIDTKLNVIQILYDYFQIFSEFPCETNLLGVRS